MDARQGFKTAWLSLSSWRIAGHHSRAPRSVAITTSKVAATAQSQPGLMQWSKIAEVLSGGIGAAVRAGQLQSTASQQLDAASYALDILKFELAAAMSHETPAAATTSAVQMFRPLRPLQDRQSLAA